jgi:glucuronokinase
VRATGRAYARAALAGNPSDGYGGAVLAVTLRDFAADVELAPSDEARVEPPDASDLMGAALARFERLRSAAVDAADRGSASVSEYRARCRTTIPRQVGLAGSSAIVIATLRAVCKLHGLELEPGELAELAWRAETEELGHPAGPQDRYAQAHEGLVLMDFAGDVRVERLDPQTLPSLFLAFRADAPEPSPEVHAELRHRAERDSVTVNAAMAELAGLAREAGRRLREGEDAAIGPHMTRSFELRQELVPLDPRHERMVEIARSHGADANYAGSGGAIVGTTPARDTWRALRAALEAEGCTVIQPEAG